MKRDFWVFCKWLAFIAVLLAAIVALLQVIFRDQPFLGTISLIKEIALIAGVVLSGWACARVLKPRKVWAIIYWIAAVLCILGAIFGSNIL